MSFADQFFGGPLARVPKVIINAHSSGGQFCAFTGLPGNVVLSGALTANTLKTILNYSGQGVFHWAYVYTNDATTRTVRLKVTLDGAAIPQFDATSGSIAANPRGITTMSNALTGSTAVVTPPPDKYPFYSSLKIEIASSLTETDLIGCGYSYVQV